MPAISGAHHVALTITDPDRSVAWYQDLLGLVELVRATDEGVVFAVLADVESGLAIVGS